MRESQVSAQYFQSSIKALQKHFRTKLQGCVLKNEHCILILLLPVGNEVNMWLKCDVSTTVCPWWFTSFILIFNRIKSSCILSFLHCIVVPYFVILAHSSAPSGINLWHMTESASSFPYYLSYCFQYLFCLSDALTLNVHYSETGEDIKFKLATFLFGIMKYLANIKDNRII